MVDLQSQHVLEGSQLLTEDEICEIVLGRRLSYSKGLGWGLKPKSRMSATSSSFSNIYHHSTHMVKVSKLKASLEHDNHMIVEQRMREEE